LNIFHEKAKIMRCPKCGYISFDHQETCRNCKKNIRDSVGDINGTIYDALAPQFLQMRSAKHFHAETFSPREKEKVEEIMDFGVDFSVRKGIDTEFTLDEESAEDFKYKELASADEPEELVLDLDDFSEVSPTIDGTIDLDDDNNGTEPDVLTLDFGDLDISDLAPPVSEESDAPSLEEDLIVLTAVPESSASKEKAPAVSQTPPEKKSAMLEDLQFNELDLDTSAKLVTGSLAGKVHSPPVKTGTALDKFDIDLGELFADNKEQKSS
jgi:biotin carboxyl carrier protein